jgi:D-glycero-D-manno-heptose 1,7-bisphosphate phosphatase
MTERRRPPTFLDREGTLIVEKHYLKDPAQVLLEREVALGLSRLAAQGHPLIVLSNQSGIGRGLLDARDAERVNARVADLLREQGIEITAWYLCPHEPTASCDCRKPAPGMALAAARDLNVELKGSFVIGDKRSDVELADAIGGTGILVATGHGVDAVNWARSQHRPVFEGFGDAADYIITSDVVNTATRSDN